MGKGTHRAIAQLQAYVRDYRYVLRLDIVQHFPSLDHAILQEELHKVIEDAQVRWLIAAILHSGEAGLREADDVGQFPHDSRQMGSRFKGIPIGNLTSQFWSNCYLNPLDWFVTRQLGCRTYLRYVDDFALFSDSKQQLWRCRNEIIAFLAGLRLRIHRKTAEASLVIKGIPWLGFVVYPTHRRLKRRKVVQFRRRLAANISRYQQGQIPFAELDASVQGWINHVRYGDTWRLRQKLLAAQPVYPPNLSTTHENRFN